MGEKIMYFGLYLLYLPRLLNQILMQKTRFISFFLPLVFAFLSCHTSYQSQSVKFDQHKITPVKKQDEKIIALLRPYADSVNKSMNDVIVVSDKVIEKGQPEGALGDLLADIMLASARRIFNTHVDAAILNDGGIRMSWLPAGNITRGRLFELMPFDNMIVLQKLPGNVLQSFLDHIASKKGWPVSGITMQIKDANAIDVKINGVPLDMAAMYTIALPDYVAGGGDDAAMLRNIPQQNNGYIFRDEMIAYLSGLNKQGLKVNATTENRVSYAK